MTPPTHRELLAQAEKLGRHDAKIAGKIHAKIFGHPGDDTGKCAATAYAYYGPDAAAQIFAMFARGYRAVAPSSGAISFSDEELVKTCIQALSADPRLGREEWDLIRRALETEMKYGLGRP